MKLKIFLSIVDSWKLITLSFIGIASFILFSEPRGNENIQKFLQLQQSLQHTLDSQTFEPSFQTPDFLQIVSQNWEKQGIAKVAPEGLVYPTLGIRLRDFDSEDEKQQLLSRIQGRYILLDHEEQSQFFGPVIHVSRYSIICPIKATPPIILSLKQLRIDQIQIDWDDDSPENIERTGVEEYQLFRYETGKKETLQRLTPTGYQEKIFIDSQFPPGREYSYFVVTKVKRVTPWKPPFPLESMPSETLSIKTDTNVGIHFNGIAEGAIGTRALVTVYKFYQGEWLKQEFNIKRGDIIGGKKTLKFKGGEKVEIDFTTPYEVFDYAKETRIILGRQGHTINLPNQPRLQYFDEKRNLVELWKFNLSYDVHLYK